MIHELKQPKTKSDHRINDCVTHAGKICREKNVASIAITIVEKSGTFHTYESYSHKGSSTELIGCMDYHKQEIIKKLMKKNDV